MNARSRMLGMIALTLAALSAGAQAQGYPNRPIRLIVPFTTGGGNDTLARLFGQKLTEAWGQTVVVENRPGAGGTIGTALVATAPPDGYTLLISSIATHAVSPQLYKDPGYDPLKNFTPIALLGVAPVVMGVNQSVPAKTVAEFIALAKAKPGALKYGSGGNGSVMHTAGMVFSQAAGISMLHVPYKGAGPAYIALGGTEVDVVIDTTAALLPLIRSGRVRGLAVARKSRLTDFPELPTFAEAGLPGYEANGWYSMHAPAGTSPEIVARLNQEINRILALPDVQERYRLLSTDGTPGTPAQLDAFVKSERAKYVKVIKDAGMVAE
ncbi:MAG: Bug family tripartite tricarboxylate transporter substrate binding protein [Burkholderiales bacterium]